MTTSPKLLPIHRRFDISFTHGKGVYLYDGQKKYLDFGAGIAVNALGHCHEKIVEALNKQAGKLWHVSNNYNIWELNNYAEKLTAQTFADYAFFCNSGAEAVECVIKMIRKYFFAIEKSYKARIITFEGAFHGRTLATIAAAGRKENLEGFGPALEGFDNVKFNDIKAVEAAINENTAGILIEPIQGDNGIVVADKSFLKELRDLANQYNLLLAFDEVQCGMGRTGYLYAYEYFEVIPDLLSSAKAIGGGFPLGACLATKKAASGMKMGNHGTTFGGNPLAMAVADAVLEVIVEPEFLQNVQNNGKILKDGLENLKNKYPNLIEEVRGVGLMLALKINSKYDKRELIWKLTNQGLLTIPADHNTIRLMPPLIVERSHIEEALEILDKVLVTTPSTYSLS